MATARTMDRIVSKQEAIEIALARLRRLHGEHEALLVFQELIHATDAPIQFMMLPGQFPVDREAAAEEPVWYVYVPWCDGLDGQCLRSGRVVAVSKIGGCVVFDGLVADEG